jgi:hypothetical protein
VSDTHAKHEAKFLAFHQANPHVYAELRRLAIEAKANGAQKVGIKMLWEVMRWNQRRYIHTDDPGSEFKLNNNYPSFYARLLMESEPELAGLFELRGDHGAAVESIRHLVSPEFDPAPAWSAAPSTPVPGHNPPRDVDLSSCDGAADQTAQSAIFGWEDAA